MYIIALFLISELYFYNNDIVSSMTWLNHFRFMYINEIWWRDSLWPVVTFLMVVLLKVTSMSTQGHIKVKDMYENVVMKKGYLAEIGH